jgi:chemotaxis protein methyltransferase CheR
MEGIINQILHYLLEQRGLDFTGNRASMLKRRIAKRLFTTKTKNFSEYFEYLIHHPKELDSLLNILTINVSSFFRDPLMWDNFDKHILAEILNENQSRETIRIWSAGCASGEEPYTIAILLKELFELEKRNYKSYIFATDIDNETIIKAKTASYKFESIKNIKLGFVQKYFKISEDEYKLIPSIKSMVEFSFFDLLDKNKFAPSESIYANFDVIFCRNVLIYFNIKYQNLIYEKLYRSLKKGGYLILGEAETISNNYKPKFYKYNECCKIHKKR